LATFLDRLESILSHSSVLDPVKRKLSPLSQLSRDGFHVRQIIELIDKILRGQFFSFIVMVFPRVIIILYR